MRTRIRFSLLLTAALLPGCAIMPSPGPTASAMTADQTNVDVVAATPALAESRDQAVEAKQQDAVDKALATLHVNRPDTAFRFAAGTTLNVVLWSIAPSSGDGTAGGGLSSMPLGNYTIPGSGDITLPYVGSVHLAGLSLDQGQSLIAARYETRRLIQSPSVRIDVGSVPQGSVVVTGAVGNPKVLPWTPAGITLAEALTEALGNGTAEFETSTGLSNQRSAIQVSVFRGPRTHASLPIAVALEDLISLEQGDRVVVTKAPRVKVTVLGGGIQKNGEFDFAETPSLAEVLATASGLNGSVANDHAVFVLETPKNEKPVLFNFEWNKIQGLIASEKFPIENGDLVYVAEAPIVPVERVINLLYQAAVPASLARY